MALSEQLKSNMAANTDEVAEIQVQPAAETGSEQPEEESVPEEKTGQENTDKNRMNLLLSIEEQLRGINSNMYQLKNVVDGMKAPDTTDVENKISELRTGLVNLTALGNSINTAVEKLVEANREKQAEEEKTEDILELIKELEKKIDRNDRQLSQTLRENANFQIQVRQGMQKDIDDLKEQVSGEQFTPILKEVATVYSEYQTVLEDENLSDRTRRNLDAMFGQMEDLLTDYGADVVVSKVGAVRRTRTCKIIEKVYTGDQEKHNTIVRSRKPGVVRDRTVLYPELVDVYVFDPALAKDEKEDVAEQPDEQVQETVQPTETADNTVTDKTTEQAADKETVETRQEEQPPETENNGETEEKAPWLNL